MDSMAFCKRDMWQRLRTRFPPDERLHSCQSRVSGASHGGAWLLGSECTLADVSVLDASEVLGARVRDRVGGGEVGEADS